MSHLAAVPDDEVGAGPARSSRSRPARRPARRRSRARRRRRAPPVRSMTASTWSPSATHRVVGAELLGQLERVGVAVDDDDLGRGQRGQALDADVAEAAGADHDARGARVAAAGYALRTAWYAVMPASASAATSFGWVDGSSFTQARAEVSRYSAIPPSLSSPGNVLFDAVHVVAGPAGPAQPAGRRRVQDHRVADGHVGHRGADLVHPAGVLVADRVGQRRAHRLGPLALDDVQVGAAHAGAADLDDHVERAR